MNLNQTNIFDTPRNNLLSDAISPIYEAAAYEAIWEKKLLNNQNTTFKRISDYFKSSNKLLSDIVDKSTLEDYKNLLLEKFEKHNLTNIGINCKSTADYPHWIGEATNPLEIFYYQGDLSLAYTKSIAVIGSRKASDDGLRRARKLARQLVAHGYTIVSGLAEGIDTAAHSSALQVGGKTIAVIGTPLSHCYPKINKSLQEKIANEHLLISQVPFFQYEKQDYRTNRYFFPERNATMSAFARASVIVEAGETSGTLTQARAAIAQGRKLFILNSCFNNPKITWPHRYAEKGAIRVSSVEDILISLGDK